MVKNDGRKQTMKALIIVKEEKCRWLRELLPSQHPAMLSFCNKPLLEFLLDFSILCGALEVRFVFDHPDARIEDYFGDGSRWGVALSYAAIRKLDRCEDILQKNSGFLADASHLVIEGYAFIRFDKNCDYRSYFTEQEGRIVISEDDGMGRAGQNGELLPLQVPEKLDLELCPLREVADIFSLTMDILGRDARKYILPGYNNEEDVYIGRNVTLAKSATIHKPLLLGNNVQIEKGCEIGPMAVIGSNVIIDSGSQVSHAIVLDNSYIGADLTFKEKIVQGNIALSSKSGKAFQFVDTHLLSGIKRAKPRKPQRLVLHWFLSLLFFVIGILPASLCRFILKKKGNWQCEEKNILLADGTVLAVCSSAVKTLSVAGKIARGLLLDKVFLLPTVLRGRIDLVGNKPLPATDEGKILFDDFSDYMPGVFFFSEAEEHGAEDFEEEITERFFAANRSLIGDLKVLCNVIINRW